LAAAAAAATTMTMILGLGSQLLMHALCNNGSNNTADGCITEWPCCHSNNTALPLSIPSMITKDSSLPLSYAIKILCSVVPASAPE
jgi:hypothetical protein